MNFNNYPSFEKKLTKEDLKNKDVIKLFKDQITKTTKTVYYIREENGLPIIDCIVL